MTTFKRLGSAGPLVFWEWSDSSLSQTPFLMVGLTDNSKDAIIVTDEDVNLIVNPTEKDWEGKKFRLVINTQGKLAEVIILNSRG